MNGYEWHVHRREHNYRSISGNFVKFSSSVKRLSEKIYSQQAVYTPYTHLAFAAMQRAVAIDPNDAVANQAIASMYARLGRLEDAEASFKKAVALQPENLLVLDGYANFLYDQSRFDDAVDQWTAVIRLAPDHYVALVNLGSALSESGKTAEAITMYQRAIEIKPTYMAYVNLGTANARSERYPNAVQALLKALSIDDSDWLAWGNLGFAYSRMNGMDPQTVAIFTRAIQLAETARQKTPRDAFVYSDLALYYAKTGQQELGMQRLATALALSPDSGEIMAAAAETYEIVGQRERAIELARDALEWFVAAAGVLSG
jgi:serine/threonine-protein kinase